MNEADFQPLLEWLKLNSNWLLLSVFLISLIESLAIAGIIVPGVLLLFLVATVAGHLDFAVASLLMSGFLGAIAGDGISFYLGRFFKDSIPNWWPFSRYPNTLAMGERFFHKHGGKSVMFGRFIGPIRPILPLTAGMFGMPQIRFAVFNSLSALIWAPFYLLPGYLTGQAVNLALPADLLPISLTLTALIIATAIVFRYLSLRLQIGSPIYDALLVDTPSNRFFESLQGHYQSFKKRHALFEFPLASFSLLLITLSIFSLWTHIVINTHLLTDINESCLNTALSIRAEMGALSIAISKLATHVTLLGDKEFLFLSFSLLIIFMLRHRQYFAALHVALAGIVTTVVTLYLKQYFGIDRPDVLIAFPASLAYPSGHSSGATVFFALLASFMAQEMNTTKRWQPYLILAIPILFIALSRVLLGVHWFTDVIAGISLGLIISSMTRISYSYFHAKDNRTLGAQKIFNIRNMLGFMLLWVMVLVVYQLSFFSATLADMRIAH